MSNDTHDHDRRSESRWQWEAIENLRRETREGHSRLREDFSQSQHRISAEVRQLDDKVDTLKDAVRDIQTERRYEEKILTRRYAMLSLSVAGAVSFLIKLFELFWSR